MMHLIKADFKKVFYLKGYRNFLIATFLLSIFFGITFLFTIDLTAGKKLTALSSIEVMDITLLGIDVTTIMLIIFIANFISKEFSTDAIHTSLAITPLRQKYFLSKILFIVKLTILVSIALTSLIFIIDQFILSINNMARLSLLNQALLIKLIGAAIMPIFYSLLSMAGTFYTQSAAGGITFVLGVMFMPALIKMFPTNFSDIILPIFPEHSLHVFTEINTNSLSNSLINAVLILLLWIFISNLLGFWKFKKSDF